MKSSLFVCVCGVALIGLSASSELVLATRDGAALPIEIVTPGASADYAARELAKYTEKLVGVRPAIATNVSTTAIRLVCDDGAQGPDGFRLQAAQGVLTVTGGRRGLIYGVYELLETYGGVRFYTSWHEKVPHLARFIVPDNLATAQRPAFMMREPTWRDNRVPGQGLKFRLNGPSARLSSELGSDDFRFVRGLPNCHTTLLMLPTEKYFKTHPEYYSEIDGVRRDGKTQLCLTNPDVLELVVSNVLDRIAKDPKAKYYGVAQMDWANYCTCAKCKAVDDEEESHMGTQLRFANAVAERVAKVYPDKICETIAYEYTQTPPKKTRPRPGMMICLCSVYCEFSKSYSESRYPRNAEFLRDLKAWSTLADNLYVWDYTTDFRNYLKPMANLNVLQKNIQILRDHGVKSVYAQGGYQGWHADNAELKSYLISKLLWNPDIDVAAVTQDFLEGYYGAAAPFVKRYLDALHAVPRDETKTPLRIFDEPEREKVLSAAFLDEATELWRQAEEAVKGQPAYSYNVRMSALAVQYWRVLTRKSISLRRETAANNSGVLAQLVLDRLDEATAAGRPVKLSEWAPNYEPTLRRLKATALGTYAAARGRIVFPEQILHRGHDGFVQAILPDPQAEEGKALKIFNNDANWYTTWGLKAIDFEPGAKYRLRVKARAELTGVEGPVFSIGVQEQVKPKSHGQRKFFPKDLKADYTWYDVMEWVPGENDLLWIMPGQFDRKKYRTSPVHNGVWIDGLEIERMD